MLATHSAIGDADDEKDADDEEQATNEEPNDS